MFNTAACYLPSLQNMKAKGYSSILLPEIKKKNKNKKQVVIITLFCSEVKTLANNPVEDVALC